MRVKGWMSRWRQTRTLRRLHRANRKALAEYEEVCGCDRCAFLEGEVARLRGDLAEVTAHAMEQQTRASVYRAQLDAREAARGRKR